MTFGAIIRLYKNLRNDELKRDIAKYYGYNSTNSFENNLESLLLIRNSCAHGNVLFDLNIPKAIKNGPAGDMKDNKSKLAGVILVIKHFLGFISRNRLNDFDCQLQLVLSDKRRTDCVNDIIRKCSGLNF